VLCPALHEESHDLAYMLMHYTFFPTKGQQVMTVWVVSEEGEQFWRERLASYARKAGSSAIFELAVIVVLYLSYTPFQRTARSGDEACSPTEVLIPFLNNLSEKYRQQLLVSLGNTLLRRIGVHHGKDCFQLVCKCPLRPASKVSRSETYGGCLRAALQRHNRARNAVQGGFLV
jgi:hypothetical protein